MNSDDEKKLTDDEIFGSDDDSLVGKLLRGELELTFNDNNPGEKPVFWETMSMHSDGTIVNCVKGQYKIEWKIDNPNYEQILSKVNEQFPDLAAGKVCTLNRFQNGRTEIETKDVLGLRNTRE